MRLSLGYVGDRGGELFVGRKEGRKGRFELDFERF